MSRRPSLADIAEHIPMGHACRSCGGSSYNWVTKCARYAETGATCCADMREWVRLASEGAETVAKRGTRRRAEEARIDALMASP